MKTAKKLFAAFLAVMMIAALAVPAFAAGDTFSITITSGDGSSSHKFYAYQIFRGTVSTDGKTLTDIDWGSGVNTNTTIENKTLIDAINAIEVDGKKPFVTTDDEGSEVGCKTAADVAAVLNGEAKDSTLAVAFAEVAAKYLNASSKTEISVIGTTSTYSQDRFSAGYYLIQDELEDADASSDLMLVVVEDVNINAKVDTATVDKYAGVESLEDNTSYGVGDKIPFTLVGTLPSDFSADADDTDDAAAYRYQFVDTMDEHLAPVDTWKYNQADTTQVTAGVTVKIDGTDVTGKFTITYKDHILTIGIDNLKEITDVNVTKDSVITVTYEAELVSMPDDGSGVSNKVQVTYETDAQTVEKVETVFPINLIIDKIDGATLDENGTITDDTTHLAGAVFQLSRSHNNNGIAVTEYLVVNNGTISWTTDKDNASKLETDGNGKIALKGLAAGTYILTEIAAPDTYNKLEEDVTLVITGTVTTDTATGAKQLTGLGITVDEVDGATDEQTSTVTAVIANNQGATLPSTGGMGTTIFYVVGGILVVGAVVLLVTRKRMDKE